MPYYERKNTRHPAHDYASEAAYFVTAVARKRQLLLEDDRVVDAVVEVWRSLETRFPGAVFDAFVVMPNHIPRLLALDGSPTAMNGRAGRALPLQESDVDTRLLRAMGLPEVMAAFKSLAAREVNAILRRPGKPVWQRSFHDRIVRSENSIEPIRQYIWTNPERWECDAENPSRTAWDEDDQLLRRIFAADA